MIVRSLVFLFTARAILAGPRIEAAGGNPEFSFIAKNLCGLSGLTWCRDDLFYAVSDRQRAIIPIRITLDRMTGLITAAKVESVVPVKTTLDDFEDIAWDAARGVAFVSTEKPPAIAGFTLAGRPAPLAGLPRAYLKARPNLSMESLTKNAAAGRAWTANEDTLPADGAVSSPDSGGIVRLQEFDAGWNPLRQFAWRTGRSVMRFRGSGTGVSALCLLDGGSLLVMERVVVGVTLEVRLYHANFTGATNTAPIPALAGIEFAPAQKQLLYRKAAGLTNWEGLAAGPRLDDGSQSLILVADSGNGTVHSLLALKIQPPQKR